MTFVLPSPSPALHTTAVGDSRAGSEPWHCLPGAPCPGSGKVLGAAEHGVTREKAQSSLWLGEGSDYSHDTQNQLCLEAAFACPVHFPAAHPAPSHQRGAEPSRPPYEPSVVWLKHFHLLGRLWKEMLEHLGCLMAAPALSLWDLRAGLTAVCGVTCCVSPCRL